MRNDLRVRGGWALGFLGLLLTAGCSASGGGSSQSTAGARPGQNGGGASGSGFAGAGGSRSPNTSGASGAGGAGGGQPTDGAGAHPIPAPDGGMSFDDGGSTGPTEGQPDTAPADGAPPPNARPSPGCTGGGASAMSATVNLMFGGLARSYILHVPPAAGGGAPLPFVVNLHGYYGTADQQQSTTNMSALADQEGFVVAYPNGVGNPTDWNAGACCSAASEGDRDDKGFIGAVIDDVGGKTCVDLNRVFAAGFSNGGMMSYRLGCEMSDRFAAFASVSGSAVVPLDTCQPSHPMPMMHFHGTADPLVPYDGGPGGLGLSGRPTPTFPGAAAEVAAFHDKAHCPATKDSYFSQGNASCDHWGPCDDGAEVILCTIAQGGHAWPGGTGIYGESSALDATKEIWTFFARHSLP